MPPTYKVPKQSFLSGYSLVANIIFSFQGQSEFYEMAAEMKNPKKFPLSLGMSQVTMTFCYLFTSILAYSYGGGEGELLLMTRGCAARWVIAGG